MSTYFINPPSAAKTYAEAGALGADVDLGVEFATVVGSSSQQRKNARQIYVGSTGDVRVQYTTGSLATFYACPVGTTLVGEFSKLIAAGTSAQKITVAW